jgi:hypothetical protein
MYIQGVAEKIAFILTGNRTHLLHTTFLNIQGGPDITCQKNSGSLEGSNKSKKTLFIRSKIMGIN